MRGSLVRRSKNGNRWSLVLNLGSVVDPDTGKRRQQQRWFSFTGTKKEAEEQLTQLVNDHNHGELPAPSKVTLTECSATGAKRPRGRR
jgi:hypothetical protein